NWNNVHNLTISPTATIANNSANQTFAVTAADRQHLRGLGFVDSVIDLFDNNNISYTRGTVVTPDARNVTINIAGIGQVNFADDGWWIPAVDGETFQAVPGDWVLIRTLPWNMFAFDGFITNPPNLQIDTWYTDEFGWTWWEFQMPNQDVEITVNFVSNHPDGHSFLRVYGVGPSGTIFWSHGQFLPAGERVILLNNPVSGHRFDRWEVASGGGILEVVDSQTQFIMPATDAVIRGVYVADPNAPAINITSNDEQLGWVSYSLFFDEDGLLWARINADVAWDVEGIMFDRWEIISGNITIDDLNRPSTSFPMPETGHVEIRAIFREMVNPQTVTVSTNNVVWGQAILDGYWAGAAGLSRQFEPGRTIRLDAWASSGQLVRWETLPDIELTYVETVDSLSHFTFVMPAHDVNIAGIFGPLFEIEYEDIVTDAIEDALPPGDSANLTFVDDMIKGIPPGIATSILAELPEVAAVLNADGSPRPANAPLGSGTRIRFTNYAELEVVVFGDVLGTGVIDVWGIVQIMAYLERLVGEGDLHRIAADVNDTGGIDVWDIVQIRMFLEGMIDSLGN
ncbi:MAG: hypothetical protein LBE35_07830, partial [Clostridiales bacterium]|nr:hypothetical protein [Clostridiales bacterium]